MTTSTIPFYTEIGALDPLCGEPVRKSSQVWRIFAICHAFLGCSLSALVMRFYRCTRHDEDTRCGHDPKAFEER